MYVCMYVYVHGDSTSSKISEAAVLVLVRRGGVHVRGGSVPLISSLNGLLLLYE